MEQSTALRAVLAIRQGRDEDVYHFELVCTRFTGDMLNDDTLKQFFIQGFFKESTIRAILERNPITLEDAKAATRGVESIDKSYERVWRKEDETISQFIPIYP